MIEMAERVGFEPTCRFRDKTLSRRPRYDHFGTSPLVVCKAPRTRHHPELYPPGLEELLQQLPGGLLEHAPGDREPMVQPVELERPGR